MPGEIPPPPTQETSDSSEQYQAPQGYDHLLDPDWEDPEPSDPQRPAEAAAVRPDAPEPLPALAEEARAEVDAALRERKPQPPLTEADIARLTASRGRRPNEEEIAGMNAARANGGHTSIV